MVLVKLSQTLLQVRGHGKTNAAHFLGVKAGMQQIVSSFFFELGYIRLSYE